MAAVTLSLHRIVADCPSGPLAITSSLLLGHCRLGSSAWPCRILFRLFPFHIDPCAYNALVPTWQVHLDSSRHVAWSFDIMN